MNTYRIEFLGMIPNGWTVDDVFASIKSALPDAKVTKRKMGSRVSIIATLTAPSATSAVSQANGAARYIPGFVHDLMWKEVK